MSFHPFAEQGNFTIVHNIVIDKIMPTLTGAEFKILMTIIRQTVGWHREKDAISYQNFMDATGVGSASTVKKSLDQLKEKGLIIIESTEKWNSPFLYSLNKAYSITTQSEVMEAEIDDGATKSEVMDSDECSTESVALINKDRSKEKKKPPLPPLPEKLDTPRFRETWADWVCYRKESRAKLTPTTVSRQFAKLSKYPPDTAVAMLEQSMCNGWRGIFEVKQSQNGQRKSTSFNYRQDVKAGRV